MNVRKITNMIDSAAFVRRFECADTRKAELGAVYGKDETVFRVWAPFADGVTLKLYETALAVRARPVVMEKRIVGGSWGGVWEKRVQGDLNGMYYTYLVDNPGALRETIDPYARACSANGARGMVIDLRATDPEGWDRDRPIYASKKAGADVPIIWEINVDDFSASPDSGMKYKGKYLAFTERGTTVPGTDLKTGVDYLKDLGVTYVHLNPVYDFATVDETETTRADCDSFNWGYDPQNYNIPEGSYATDSMRGDVRITEFKRMVQSLHDAGIGVIMDVVYNHTYSAGGQAFHDTVPYYYHRTDESGAFTNDSGCGNGTASERTMMRKFIVESVLYWANEYHVDGFRFDLMGIHDAATLNLIRRALDNCDGGNGKRILMYGEPWSADGDYVPASYTRRTELTSGGMWSDEYVRNDGNMLIKHVFSRSFTDDRAFDVLDPRIAVFNGSGRDGLRGMCCDKIPQAGWVNGKPSELGKVKRTVEGGIGGFSEGMNVGTGSRNVAYAAAHDNYTLWDHLRGAAHGNASTLYYDEPSPTDVARNKLVAAAYLMSTGMCFMLAGEEFARTKYGNEDSYNSPSKLNSLQWSRQADFASLREHYKKLIALRKKYGRELFSYSQSCAPEYAYGMFDAANYDTGRLVFSRCKNGITLTLDLDPSELKGSVEIDGERVEIN